MMEDLEDALHLVEDDFLRWHAQSADYAALIGPVQPAQPPRLIAHNPAFRLLFEEPAVVLLQRRADHHDLGLITADDLRILAQQRGLRRIWRNHQRRAFDTSIAPVQVAEQQFIVWIAHPTTIDVDRRIVDCERRLRLIFNESAPENELPIDQALHLLGTTLGAEGVIVASQGRLRTWGTLSQMYRQELLDHGRDWLHRKPTPVIGAHYEYRSSDHSIATVVWADDSPSNGLIIAIRSQPWALIEIDLMQTLGMQLSLSIERRRTMLAMIDNETRYQLLVTHATDLISIHDRHGAFSFCSQAIENLLGYRNDELLGQMPFDLIHPDDLTTAISKGKMHDNGAITTTYRARHRDGYYLWIETSARAVCDPISGDVREIIAITRDVEARKNFEAQIERLAYYDPLTALANRRRFQELARAALDHSRRHHRGTALLYFDLDGFKKVNDSLGHDAGDELLILVANRLRAQLRGYDSLARLGGDEFAVLLPEIEHDGHVTTIAQRLVDQMRQPFTVREQVIHLGVSVGIACSPQDGTRVEELLKHADIAMYRAKREGGRFQFFDPALSQESRERLQLEHELRVALSQQQLRLEYQPIFDLRRQQVIAVEALVRWEHPQRGTVRPSHFVPIAEDSGLIRELDRHVIKLALFQLKAWHDQGHETTISINVSVRTLHDRSLIGYIRETLDRSGAPPRQVILEITESAAMRDAELTNMVLDELRNMGIRIAIDDFGSGYAALHYLKHLSLDYVKIDQSFIDGIGRSSRDEGVAKAIIALSKGLNLEIIAEGVTEEHQMAWLAEAGCWLIQGYLIGHSKPSDQIFAAQ